VLLIRLDFSPTFDVFGLPVRLETLAIAVAIFAALLAAGISAGRARAAAERRGSASDAGRLRRDSLIMIAFGAVPGALVGGRLGYGLIHLDYYLADPAALLDPGKGSLSLTLAVVLGTFTALAVARLLAAPIGAWLHVAASPLLLGLGLGKLAMAFGGSGQGQFTSDPWATAYVGPGAWGSLSPATAALPSQLLEGCLVLGALAVLAAAPFAIRVRLRRGSRGVWPELAPGGESRLLAGYRRFLTALVLWGAARFFVAFSWRDGRVLGPLVAEQLVLAVLLAACAGLLIQARRAAAEGTAPEGTAPEGTAAGETAAETAAEGTAAAPFDSAGISGPGTGSGRPAGSTGAPAGGSTRRLLRLPRVLGRPPRATPEYPRDDPESEVQLVADEPWVEPAERPGDRRIGAPRKPGRDDVG
jgi:prolipoprotein diacylglyceryltransferase